MTEFFSIAYDPKNQIFLGGTQDNGTPVERAGSAVWNDVSGGDGGNVAVGSDGMHYYFADSTLYRNNDGTPVQLAVQGGLQGSARVPPSQ